MLLAASLAILKTVFRLRRRSRNAGGLLQDGPIFLFFLGSPSNRSSGSLFSSLFLHFTVLGLHFDPQLGPLGLTFRGFSVTFRGFSGFGPHWARIGLPLGPRLLFGRLFRPFGRHFGTFWVPFSSLFRGFLVGGWVGWWVG